MTEDNNTLTADTEPAPEQQFDIIAYLGEGEQNWVTLLTAGDFENAAKAAENCIQTLQGLPEEFVSGLDEQNAAFLRREISFFQVLHNHAIGIFRNKSRDFRGSGETFEKVIETTRGVSTEPIAEEDPRPYQFKYFSAFAESRIPLLRASEALLRGDPSGAFRGLSNAEAVVEEIMPEILGPDGNADINVQPKQAGDLLLVQKLDIYASFVIDAAMLYTGAVALGANLDAAADFFERHEAKVSRLQDNLKSDTASEVLAQIWQPLIGFFSASRCQVDARIALEKEDFAAALEKYKTAQKSFGELSRTIPRKLPNSELLREVSHNMSYNSLPQMIERVEREKALSERIAFLETQNETRAQELREAMLKREEIIRDFLASLHNLNIHINNEVDIQQTLNLSVALPDRGLEAVMRALEEIRWQIPEQDAKAVEAAVKDAKGEADFSKKLEKVAKAIDTFSMIAESVSSLVPYGRTAYKILRSVFS